MRQLQGFFKIFKFLRPNRYVGLIWFLSVGMLHIGQAQDIEQEKKRANQLLSPFHAIYNHYHNLKPQTYNPTQASLSLSPNFLYASQKAKEELAIKLGQILDGNGLYLDYQKVPKENNFFDSTLKKSVYYPFPRFKEIYLEKVGFNWFYSPTTVEAIPRLYDRTFPFDSENLSKLLGHPKTGGRFLGLTWQQYLGLLLLLILPSLLHKLLTWLVALILRILIRFSEEEIKQNKIRRLARPISLFVVFWWVEQVIPILQLPAILSYYLRTAINLCLPVFGVILAIGLINVLITYLQHFAKKRSNIWYEQLIPFIRTTLQVIAIIWGIFYMLEALSLNVTAVLAGLSIGGLAVALAAQDTIKNLFGSLMIFIDQPFKVGDWITAEGIEGDVEEIGVRTTRIRTFYNSILYIPNGKIADMTIDNMGMRVYRRYRTMLNLNYDTSPATIKAFVRGLKEIILQNPHTRKDFYGINFNEYGNHSLNILFNVFFSVPTIEAEWEIREVINLQILELAEALQIRFAFPTQTIHVENFPGHSPQPESNLSAAQLNQKLNDFLLKMNYQPIKMED
ncbi:MAG: mechanosensitive ion channel family protein [Microscillaceae bacterium]|jgi:MscS family membrane protein|nr:mechanosensitive ion channel family protein [Microscillaceae bacterium]